MTRPAARPDKPIEGALARFGHRLDSILGQGRVRARDKKAKAEEAIRAVDDLIREVHSELGELDRPK